MTTYKYRLELVDVPSELYVDSGGDDALEFVVNRLSGAPVTLTMKDQEIVSTTDELANSVFEDWHAPKIPIWIDSGSGPEPAAYDFDDWKNKRPFVAVAVNSTHQYVV